MLQRPHLIVPVAGTVLLMMLGASALAQGEAPPPAVDPEQPAQQTPPTTPPPILPALPEGHPDISAMLGEGDGEEAPVVVSTIGSLAVKAIQGTAGGPALANLDIEIHLYRGDQDVEHIERTLDEYGVTVLEDLDVVGGLRPVAKIEYGNVTYSRLGELMDPANPTQVLELLVYEVTEEEPAWFIESREVVVHHTSEGLDIMETIKVVNPTDRTWFGIPDGSGKGDAFVVDLTHSAGNLRLGEGFHGWCCAKFSHGLLVNQMPMMPGTAQYGFAYQIPITRGKADLLINAPADTGRMLLYLPEDGSTAIVQGLTEGEPFVMGESTIRVYNAAQVLSGRQATVRFTGLASASTAGSLTGSASYARLIAGLGAGLLVIAAVIFMIVKAPGQSGSSSGTARMGAQRTPSG